MVEIVFYDSEDNVVARVTGGEVTTRGGRFLVWTPDGMVPVTRKAVRYERA